MAMVSSTDFMRASERPTTIATLNSHRHLTPSCGGLHTYRGVNSGPAKMITENLTPRPGIRQQNLPGADIQLSHSITTPSLLAHGNCQDYLSHTINGIGARPAHDTGPS